MKQIIFSDIKSIMRSKRFWIVAGIFIISAIINLVEMVLGGWEESAGMFGLFIYGNIYTGLVGFLSPFIPAFLLVPLFFGDMKMSAFKAQSLSLKKYIATRSISACIVSGSVFIVSYLIVFLGCVIVDPSIQMIEFQAFGLFEKAYYTSVPLYMLLFILYSAFFGALYGLLSMGIGMATKSTTMAMIIPGIIYSLASVVTAFFSNTVYTYAYIMRYEILIGMPLFNRIFGSSVILLIAVVMTIIGYFRLKKEVPLDNGITNMEA